MGMKAKRQDPDVQGSGIHNGMQRSSFNVVPRDVSDDRGHPAPCNESYVSYACAQSTDGIVHEPPGKWLGALLPVNHNDPTTPPIPGDWLRIHGHSFDPTQVVQGLPN